MKNRTPAPLIDLLRMSTLMAAVAVCVSVALAQEKPRNAAHDAGIEVSTAASSAVEANSSPCEPESLCRKNAFCFNAGPFTATIVQFTDGTAGNYRRIRLNLRFQNLTTRELTLAYHARRSVLTDEAGSTYFCCKAGDSGPDTSASGIGTNQEGTIDARFRLEAKQFDFATFEVWGVRKGKDDPRSFHYDVAIDQLDPNNPKVVLRQRVLFFRGFNAKSKFTSEWDGAE